MNKLFRNSRPLASNRLWFLAGLMLFLLISFGLTKEIVNRRQILRQIAEYEADIAALSRENASLNEKIGNWDESGELELNARTILGLEKPGEQTIVISRPASADSGRLAIKSNQQVIDLSADKDGENSKSNAAKWWEYFFHQPAAD